MKLNERVNNLVTKLVLKAGSGAAEWFQGLTVTKVIALTVVNCLLLSFVAGQSIASILDARRDTLQLSRVMDSFCIPQGLGRVTDARFFGSDQVVVNIQDLHCHPEVQRNISGILSFLDEKYHFNNLYLEGAYAPVDTSWLSGIGNAGLRKKLTESFVNKGELTGAEYYSIQSGKPRIIQGLENREQYLSNLKRLGVILNAKGEIDRVFASVAMPLESVKHTYFNAEQKRLDSLSVRFDKGDIEARKYYTLLKKRAEKQGMNIGAYRNFSTYLQLLSREKYLDYSRVAGELRELVGVLRQRLPYSVYSALVKETHNFADTDKLYASLIRISRENHLDLINNFPSLAGFFSYIEASRSINPMALVREERHIVRELSERLAKNRSERETAFLLSFQEYLRDYLANKITAEDYAYFNENLRRFKQLYAKYGDAHKLALLTPYFVTLNDFYTTNLQRNDHFMQVLVGDSRSAATEAPLPLLDEATQTLQSVKNQDKLKVVVTGGFHTEGLARLLADRHISYVVITPSVTQDTKISEEAYVKLAKEQSRIMAQTFANIPASLLTKSQAAMVASGVRDMESTSGKSVSAIVLEVNGILNGVYKDDHITAAAKELFLDRIEGETLIFKKNGVEYQYDKTNGWITPGANGQREVVRNMSVNNRKGMAEFMGILGLAFGTASTLAVVSAGISLVALAGSAFSGLFLVTAGIYLFQGYIIKLALKYAQSVAPVPVKDHNIIAGCEDGKIFFNHDAMYMLSSGDIIEDLPALMRYSRAVQKLVRIMPVLIRRHEDRHVLIARQNPWYHSEKLAPIEEFWVSLGDMREFIGLALSKDRYSTAKSTIITLNPSSTIRKGLPSKQWLYRVAGILTLSAVIDIWQASAALGGVISNSYCTLGILTLFLSGVLLFAGYNSAPKIPEIVQRNIDAGVITDTQQIAIIKELLRLDQGRLFDKWQEPGINNKKKGEFLAQLIGLDKSYPGGLAAYVENGRELLRKSKEGNLSMGDSIPSVPDGVDLSQVDDEKLESFTETGLETVSKVAFVMVAGGLGERLGYDGIKAAIPLSLVTMESYVELYIKNIQALQEKSNRLTGLHNERIPFTIMTSGDTDDATREYLRKKGYTEKKVINKLNGKEHVVMQQGEFCIDIVKQENVPALKDNAAHFCTEADDPYKVQTKPHGHGDVHMLLHQHGLVEQWAEKGKTHTVFIQDTNGQVFNGVLPGLGVSVKENIDMNFLTVPRSAGEKAGAIVQINYPDGTKKTGNIEYNQLSTLLPGGDVADTSTGLSPYPGNLNVFILKNDPYLRVLRETHGIIGEFVNPKYSDKEKTVFSATRLETMMQDIAFQMGRWKVGFTNFEKRMVFSPVKNALNAGAQMVEKGNYPDAMPTGEADYYQYFRGLLKKAGVTFVGKEEIAYTQNVPYTIGAKIILSPWFAVSPSEARYKFKNSKITEKSTLVIDGEKVFVDGLDLDGALVIKVTHGVTLHVRNIRVRNDGFRFVDNEHDPDISPAVRIRGYRLEKNGGEESHLINLTEPGEYEAYFDDAGNLKTKKMNDVVGSNDFKEFDLATKTPEIVQRNIDAGVITDPQQKAIIEKLLHLDQGRLFKKWEEPGKNDKKKRGFLAQLVKLDNDDVYPGGLTAYVQKGRELLNKSKEGTLGMVGITPEVPKGVDLSRTDDKTFESFTDKGLKIVNKVAFVMVAGGRGERLGYNGIKAAIPLSLVTMESYLDVYIEYIKAFQEKSNRLTGLHDERIPFTIMTSGDTDDATREYLRKKGYTEKKVINKRNGKEHVVMQQGEFCIDIVKQENVPALKDNEAHFCTEDDDPYTLQVKPHGHGDVHMLLNQHGLVEQWTEKGKTHTVFIQDTNGQVFNGVLPGLGVSISNEMAMNSLTVDRSAGERAGAIVQISYPDGTKKTGNIEYNQLEEILPGGDVAAPGTELSPYPGNLNVFIIENNSYLKVLSETRGFMDDSVNPKYDVKKDPERNTFESSTRLEAMMQDIAYKMGQSNVGFTNYVKRWVFSPVKNSLVGGVGMVGKKNYPDAMPTGEADYYKYFRRLLEKAGVTFEGEEGEAFSHKVPYTKGAKIVLSPWWAVNLAEVKEKIINSKITQKSTLVIKGENIYISNLFLDGALVINVARGVTLHVRDLRVENAGFQFADVDVEHDANIAPAVNVRGYKLEKLVDEKKYLINITEPGEYEAYFDDAGNLQARKIETGGKNDETVGTTRVWNIAAAAIAAISVQSISAQSLYAALIGKVGAIAEPSISVAILVLFSIIGPVSFLIWGLIGMSSASVRGQNSRQPASRQGRFIQTEGKGGINNPAKSEHSGKFIQTQGKGGVPEAVGSAIISVPGRMVNLPKDTAGLVLNESEKLGMNNGLYDRPLFVVGSNPDWAHLAQLRNLGMQVVPILMAEKIPQDVKTFTLEVKAINNESRELKLFIEPVVVEEANGQAMRMQSIRIYDTKNQLGTEGVRAAQTDPTIVYGTAALEAIREVLGNGDLAGVLASEGTNISPDSSFMMELGEDAAFANPHIYDDPAITEGFARCAVIDGRVPGGAVNVSGEQMAGLTQLKPSLRQDAAGRMPLSELFLQGIRYASYDIWQEGAEKIAGFYGEALRDKTHGKEIGSIKGAALSLPVWVMRTTVSRIGLASSISRFFEERAKVDFETDAIDLTELIEERTPERRALNMVLVDLGETLKGQAPQPVVYDNGYFDARQLIKANIDTVMSNAEKIKGIQTQAGYESYQSFEKRNGAIWLDHFAVNYAAQLGYTGSAATEAVKIIQWLIAQQIKEQVKDITERQEGRVYLTLAIDNALLASHDAGEILGYFAQYGFTGIHVRFTEPVQDPAKLEALLDAISRAHSLEVYAKVVDNESEAVKIALRKAGVDIEIAEAGAEQGIGQNQAEGRKDRLSLLKTLLEKASFIFVNVEFYFGNKMQWIARNASSDQLYYLPDITDSLGAAFVREAREVIKGTLPQETADSLFRTGHENGLAIEGALDESTARQFAQLMAAPGSLTDDKVLFVAAQVEDKKMKANLREALNSIIKEDQTRLNTPLYGREMAGLLQGVSEKALYDLFTQYHAFVPVANVDKARLRAVLFVASSLGLSMEQTAARNIPATPGISYGTSKLVSAAKQVARTSGNTKAIADIVNPIVNDIILNGLAADSLKGSSDKELQSAITELLFQLDAIDTRKWTGLEGNVHNAIQELNRETLERMLSAA